MAWFDDNWNRLKTGSAKFAAGTRDRIRNFKWKNPSKPVLIWTGSILGVLVIGWVTLNLLLANPSTGTPMINWALGTFGGKGAQVQTGQLTHPFSNRFTLRAINWPGTFEANEIDIDYDLFGFLPGHPWAHRIFVRDGELTLQDKPDSRTTFNPQSFVDEIDAKNVAIKFMRGDKQRSITVVTAEGAFSNGSVRAEAVSGKNRITFDGLQRDWGGAMKGAVTAEGDNLKDIAEIVGASAPDTPPFKVKGSLSMQSRTWAVSDLSGRVGDSDIGGSVAINVAPRKPFLVVDLKSHKLDFDDMGVVFGIPIGAGKGETKNAEQVKAKAEFDASSRLIPDTRIDFSRLAAVNADITFVADQVVDAPSGINALNLKGTLRDSVLDFERAQVKTATGDLDAKVKINATKDPAQTHATGKLENVTITKLVQQNLIRGSLNGRFTLDFTGSGFREAAASATGEVGVWSNNSEMLKFAVEGAGLDLGEILLILATEDKKHPEYIKSRCLAANIAVKDGMARLLPAVVENTDSLVVADGEVNLKNEAVDIKLYAKPHDVSIGTVKGDIKVTGTLRHLGFSAIDEKTFIQAGLSALLSSIAGPLAALPFVQTGGEPDAPCAALVADAKETGPNQSPAAKAKVTRKS